MADEQAGRGFRFPWRDARASRVAARGALARARLARHAPLAARGRRGALRAVDRRDRGAAALSAGRSSTTRWWRSRSASARTRSSRPAAAATSSTATATCSPTPSTPIRSSPTRPRSRTSTRWRRASVPRSIAATRRSGCAIAKSLRRKGQFAWVARKVSPDEERRVRALELKGIGFVKESRRFYPKRELLAHVLGYVGARQRRPGAASSPRTTRIIRGRAGQGAASSSTPSAAS